MAQPTGPHPGEALAELAPPPSPDEWAAGRDIRFSTRLPLQAGQRTSSSSDRRSTSSSKSRWQALQLYS